VLVPAISPDGKQLAYVTKRCVSGRCSYAVVEQDVGGSTTRSILEGATAAYYLEWSPDRRNLMFNGTFNGRIGTYLLSALGGTPRWLTSGVATFFAGGDSLLIGPTIRADSVNWIRVAALDGSVHDSIRIAGAGQGIAAVSSMPGTGWIITLTLQQPHGLWQIVDRAGNVADHVVNACTCGGLATRDAIWVSRAGAGDGESIVRIALDPITGKLAARQDTMITALFTNFSLTADGAGMVMDEGTYDFNVWALDFPSVLKGSYPDDRRVAHASSPVNASLSPDGARLLVRRAVPIGGNRVEQRYSVMPFSGGSEAALGGSGIPVNAFWADSVTVGVARQRSGGLHLSQIDVRTNAVRNETDLPDSALTWLQALPDGWAWIPAASDRIIVKRAGKTREYAKPPWYGFLFGIAADPDRNRLFIIGNDLTTGDSLGLGVLSLADGSTTMWTTMFAETARVSPLADGGAFLQVARTQESLTFFKLTGPNQLQSLGDSPRPIRQVSISRDMTKATVQEREYRADAWMSKVNTH
jgi:hypothetical protein